MTKITQSDVKLGPASEEMLEKALLGPYVESGRMNSRIKGSGKRRESNHYDMGVYTKGI